MTYDQNTVQGTFLQCPVKCPSTLNQRLANFITGRIPPISDNGNLTGHPENGPKNNWQLPTTPTSRD